MFACALGLVALGLVSGCGQAKVKPRGAAPLGTEELRVVPSAVQQVGPDAAARVRLVLQRRDGTSVVLPEEYLDALPFRSGAAVVTLDHALWLVDPDGSHAVLAHQVDGLPATASDGALIYAARFGETVELHWLTPAGKNAQLASFSGVATRLAPQSDRSVVFIGASSGGVAGVWIASGGRAHCLTNCSLHAGQPWGDAYISPPKDTALVRYEQGQVAWQTADGAWTTLALPVRSE